MAQDRVTRKWEIFAGRNRFYCNGRLMTAPHSGVFLLTVFLITCTSILFFVFDCMYLAENVTPAIPIIGGLLFVFTMSSLLRTSLSDPGIIPRATSEEAAYVEKQIEVTNSANSPTYRPPPRTKEVLVRGQPVKLKYCFTCKIFRPPRASHCSLCDNCVDRFDHHCPWVGNCVGRRNYRYFYMFIVSLAFLAVFIFACAVAHLILIASDNKTFIDVVKESPASLIVAIICFFSVWSILGLAGFHTYLTTSDQTTNEDIKGSFTSKRGQENFNPYSHGNFCLNCFHILCGPNTPSLIDRRGIVNRAEISRVPITTEPSIPLKMYSGSAQNGSIPEQADSDLTGIYRQTENNESNTGSVTHLVTNEQPLAIAPVVLGGNFEHSPLPPVQYSSQLSLNQVPVYSNIAPEPAPALVKLNGKAELEDLHLDPVVLREGHVLVGGRKVAEAKEEKENGVLSASRLRLLQDTTMIESALDLDSLDDSSIGTNSQAGLMKIVVN